MDSFTPFWPENLPLPLLEDLNVAGASYPFRTKMESGRIRVRRTLIDLKKKVEARWVFTGDLFVQFQTFHQSTLENGTLSFAMDVFGVTSEVMFLEEGYKWFKTDGAYEVSAILIILSVPLPEWDFTACTITPALVRTGGGDSFDCYPIGSYPITFIQPGFQNMTAFIGGTGFTAAGWIIENAIINYPYGDSFDSYFVGDIGIMSAGDGFAAESYWLNSNSNAMGNGDSFDSYSVGTAGALTDGVGFSSQWEHSDG